MIFPFLFPFISFVSILFSDGHFRLVLLCYFNGLFLHDHFLSIFIFKLRRLFRVLFRDRFFSLSSALFRIRMYIPVAVSV